MSTAELPRTTTRPPGAFVGLVGVLLVAITGLLIASVAHGAPIGLDTAWHDLLASQRIPALVDASLVLNKVGGTLWMTIATAAIVGVLVLMRRLRIAVTIGLTVALAAGVSSILKVLVARPRPLDAVIDTTSDSFPSGHTTTAAALMTAIVILLPRVWTIAAASVWTLSMAFSRTYLLVHWSSDVIAGIVVGVSVALMVAALVQFAVKRVGQSLPDRPPIE